MEGVHTLDWYIGHMKTIYTHNFSQIYRHARVLSRLSCVLLFVTPWDSSLPGSSVQGILQARILEWVAMPSSRGSSWSGIEPTSLVPPALVAGFLHQRRLGSPLCTVLPPNPQRLCFFSFPFSCVIQPLRPLPYFTFTASHCLCLFTQLLIHSFSISQHLLFVYNILANKTKILVQYLSKLDRLEGDKCCEGLKGECL